MMRGLFIPLFILMSLPGFSSAQANATNPHGPLDLDCRLCHTDQSWEVDGASPDFDHDSTGYTLEGRHAQAACRDCHEEIVFSHVGISCADCHEDFHRGRLGMDCQECHSPERWVDVAASRMRHDATTFPLVGAHTRVDCDACHADLGYPEYVGTPTNCVFCHRDDYEATEDPAHGPAGFGEDCERCHSVLARTWGGGDFMHPASFPLTGGHGGLECATCHDSGFQAVPADCYSCHQQDFESADDPDHVAADFPTDCTVCHTTVTWEGAEFNHETTAFPLTGSHQTVDCASCHTNGYTGTPTDCYACHQAEYDNTSDPAHAAASFPITCASCHGTVAWEPADWDHDSLFPIYAGSHREEWNSCADCHLVPQNYALFECINCHEHNQTDMDDDHDEVGDYVYLSTACFQCHPRGEEED